MSVNRNVTRPRGSSRHRAAGYLGPDAGSRRLRGSTTSQPAVERLDPVDEPAQPGAAAGIGAADTVVVHLDDRVPVDPRRR